MTQTSRRARYAVTPYDGADKDELRRFQAEYFGPASRQCNDGYTEWLFEKNPHRNRDNAVFWVCKKDGVVVGQQASVPVVLKLSGVERRAAWGIDLMVHRAWRLKGVAPALSAEYENSENILLGLGMSSAAVRAYSRAGWRDMGRLRFAVRPLNADACVEAMQGRARSARFVPGFLVSGSTRVAAGIAHGIGRYSLEALHRFDERVDGVWSMSNNDYRILVKRDFASVRWRFDQFPEPERYERYYLTRQSAVVGYAVIRMDRWRGYTIGRVVDYLAPRRALCHLFSLVIEQMRIAGAVAVFVEELHHEARPALAMLGCFTAGAVTQFMLKVRPEGAAPILDVIDPRHWFVTRGDSDSDMPSPDPVEPHSDAHAAVNVLQERAPSSA